MHNNPKYLYCFTIKKVKHTTLIFIQNLNILNEKNISSH